MPEVQDDHVPRPDHRISQKPQGGRRNGILGLHCTEMLHSHVRAVPFRLYPKFGLEQKGLFIRMEVALNLVLLKCSTNWRASVMNVISAISVLRVNP